MMGALLQARMSLDLGAPLLEQLALVHLIEDRHAVWAANRERLRRQRDALLDALDLQLPDWSFHRPTGGLAVWCQLPAPRASTLVAEAERLGVIAAAGRVFAVEGGLEQFVRLPWTRPVDELELAVTRLAQAWARCSAEPGAAARENPDRLTVA